MPSYYKMRTEVPNANAHRFMTHVMTHVETRQIKMIPSPERVTKVFVLRHLTEAQLAAVSTVAGGVIDSDTPPRDDLHGDILRFLAEARGG